MGLDVSREGNGEEEDSWNAFWYGVERAMFVGAAVEPLARALESLLPSSCLVLKVCCSCLADNAPNALTVAASVILVTALPTDIGCVGFRDDVVGAGAGVLPIDVTCLRVVACDLAP